MPSPPFLQDTTGDRELDIVALSREYRSAAGNSFANLFRDEHGLGYHEILLDCVNWAARMAGWRKLAIEGHPAEERLEDYITTALTFAFASNNETSAAEKHKAMEEAENLVRGKVESPFTPGAQGLVVIAAGAAVAASATVLLLPLLAVRVAGFLATPSSSKLLEATSIIIHVRRRLENESFLENQVKEAA